MTSLNMTSQNIQKSNVVIYSPECFLSCHMQLVNPAHVLTQPTVIHPAQQPPPQPPPQQPQPQHAPQQTVSQLRYKNLISTVTRC